MGKDQESQLSQRISVVPLTDAGEEQDQAAPSSDPESAHETIPRPPDISDPAAYAVRITDSSMSPQLNAGDTVILSPAATYADGKVYLIREKSGQSYIRQVGKNRDRYVFSSPNPSERDFTREASEIELLHRIIWHVLG